MSPDTIFVGDPGRSAVFQFSLTDGTLDKSTVIEAPEGIKGFGRALALDREMLIIGAYARISKEEGTVYARDETRGLHVIASSDDDHVVGFAVAAKAGRVAYARRRRNDIDRQTGDVVVSANGSDTIYGSKAYPDYFGMRIDLDDNRLLAMAPALGDFGGVLLFDLRDDSVRRLALPVETARASLEHPVALLDDACLMAGAGNAARTRSVLWRGCEADRVEVIDATGEVSASSGRIVFSDNLAFPQFGFNGPFEVLLHDFRRGGNPVRVGSSRVEMSVRRNVALSLNCLAIALVDPDGATAVEIYQLNQDIWR